MASNSKKNTQKTVSLNNVRNEVVFHGIKTIVNEKRSWSGTMTNLIAVLNSSLKADEKRVMPKSPSALRVVVNRVVNRLRSRGISIKFGRTTDHARTRFVKFAR